MAELACGPAGEISYAKVRAVTRVAKAGTAEHVERIVRGWRYVDRRAEQQDARRQDSSRALQVYPSEDGTVAMRAVSRPSRARC